MPHRPVRPAPILAALGLPLLAACATNQSAPREEPIPTSQSALTPGGVKLNLTKGRTTQADVIQAFGPPDLVTHKDNQQIWTYDKTTYDYEKRSDYLTVIFAGQGGDRVRSSSRSTLLVIYFDERDVVTDYRLSAIKH